MWTGDNTLGKKTIRIFSQTIIKKKLGNLKTENIDSYKFNLQKTKKLMEEIISIDNEQIHEIFGVLQMALSSEKKNGIYC